MKLSKAKCPSLAVLHLLACIAKKWPKQLFAAGEAEDQTKTTSEANLVAGPRRGLFSLFTKRFDEQDSGADQNRGKKA